MKKYKLIKTLTLSTPVVVTPLLANSCSNNSNTKYDPNSNTKYDPFNLSTWGDKQKSIINNSYLKSAAKQSSDTWQSWNYEPDTTSYNSDALNDAVSMINQAASVYDGTGDLENDDSIFFTWLKNYSGTVKSVLSQGATGILKGIKNGFIGELTITFKGNI